MHMVRFDKSPSAHVALVSANRTAPVLSLLLFLQNCLSEIRVGARAVDSEKFLDRLHLVLHAGGSMVAAQRLCNALLCGLTRLLWLCPREDVQSIFLFWFSLPLVRRPPSLYPAGKCYIPSLRYRSNTISECTRYVAELFKCVETKSPPSLIESRKSSVQGALPLLGMYFCVTKLHCGSCYPNRPCF